MKSGHSGVGEEPALRVLTPILKLWLVRIVAGSQQSISC
jgi:hypothetical protein